jgi:hypothetical protein
MIFFRRDAAPPAMTRQPLEVRLPYFLERPMGAGDAIQRLTQAAGIPTCGGCEQRRAALNNMLRFLPRR